MSGKAIEAGSAVEGGNVFAASREARQLDDRRDL